MAKTGSEPMDDVVDYAEELREIADTAREYIESEVSPNRERGWNYYNGVIDYSPPEDTSRSDFVMSDVRDAVEAAMPLAMDMLMGHGRLAEYRPTEQGQGQLAELATDWAHGVLMTSNRGWYVLHDALKDAFTVENAVARVWFEEQRKVETFRVDLMPEELALAANDPELEFDNEETNEDGIISVDVTRTAVTGKIRIRTERPEVLVIDADAETADDARVVGFFDRKTISDVVAMNLPDVDADDLAALLNAGTGGEMLNPDQRAASGAQASEQRARTQRGDGGGEAEENAEKPIGSRMIDIGEYWIRYDGDEDGNEELLHVVMAGPNQTVIYCEPAEFCPVIVGQVYRVPHTSIGYSIPDMLHDIQDLRSGVSRGMIDNIALVNNPRKLVVLSSLWSVTAFEDNIYNGWVPVKDLEAVKELETAFIGDKAIGILEFLDKLKENRTGISARSLGLDPDAMRSLSEYYVAAVLGAPAKPLAMAVRVFAETFVAPLFQTILKVGRLHGPKLSPVQVGRSLRRLNPLLFPSGMTLEVKVGLGVQSPEEKIASLGAIVSKQEAIIAGMTIENPVVTIDQYANSLAHLTKALGHNDTAGFFIPPGEAGKRMATLQAKAAQKPPPVDPAKQAQAQAITARAQADIAGKQEDRQFKQKLGIADYQAQRQKDQATLQQKAMADASKTAAKREVDLATLSVEQRLRRLEMGLEAQLDMREQDIEAVTAVEIAKQKPKGNGSTEIRRG